MENLYFKINSATKETAYLAFNTTKRTIEIPVVNDNIVGLKIRLMHTLGNIYTIPINTKEGAIIDFSLFQYVSFIWEECEKDFELTIIGK